ncbi:CPBP family intramembrane glutamic endopeptidase [Pedobacter cryoconitis]|uniref:CAAX prenyl protease 2/Lysostaphin resistance protein A-like domain-containing protein n=1 Tax=Pedobacter cryoconitis TaxID=188932 RepID=A0A7X0J1J7_9SPHI|nr:type II CAAX endopeptidase family protein [Pedobacter cryoconitis]MBB6498984.1 hypothetical protein [Pedobacter cryoconitis]
MKENLIEKLFFALMRIGFWCMTYVFILLVLQIIPLVFFKVNLKTFFNGIIPIEVELTGAGLISLGTFAYYLMLRPKYFSAFKSMFKSKMGLLQGFLLGLVLILIIFLIILAFQQVHVSISDQYTLFYCLQSILLFLFVSLSEEIFMRGIVFRYLLLIENAEKPAILISAIIFTLFHVMSPNVTGIGLLNIFLAGILLAQVFIYSNYNIWVSIGLHWAWNFFQSSVFGFAVSGLKMQSLFHQELNGQNIVNGGNFGLEGSVITAFVMVLTILALMFWKWNVEKKTDY